MPINYKNYLADWLSTIRPRILARDGNKCKFCQVPNGADVQRSSRGHYMLANGEARCRPHRPVVSRRSRHLAT